MIEILTKDDLVEAAKVYMKGLSMEIPIGYKSLQDSIKSLERTKCFVYKENNAILGLVCFNTTGPEIIIEFICAIKPRNGIGSSLLKKLAEFALKNNSIFISSTVSTQDERALRFYEHCGFLKYGQQLDDDLLLNKIRAKPNDIIKSIGVSA